MCGHNWDVTRDEFAAEHLLQLEPNKPWEGGILAQSFKYRGLINSSINIDLTT
jgi:hypothetical protein